MGQIKILVLSSVPLQTNNYYIYLLRGIIAQAELNGFEVLQYFFKNNSSFEAIKSYISKIQPNGIICIEFFTKKWVSEINSLNIPTLFFDYPSCDYPRRGNFDIVMSENITAVSSACNLLIKKGIKLFSFVGDTKNCKSFYERFLGMREALFQNNIPFNNDLNIIDRNITTYNDPNILLKRIRALPALPECFVCSNDYIALRLLDALKHSKSTELEKINVIGFDNGPESRLSTPKLSTINTDKTAMGVCAINLLAERMKEQKSSKIVYMQSEFISRETTSILNTH